MHPIKLNRQSKQNEHRAPLGQQVEFSFSHYISFSAFLLTTAARAVSLTPCIIMIQKLWERMFFSTNAHPWIRTHTHTHST